MTETAIILAAGMGTRLAARGSGELYSKPLMIVGGQTLLERTVRACRAAGARRILVVTGFHAGLVEQEVARLSRGDLEVVHNPDWEKANGLSLYACRERVAAPFALMMSDHVFDSSILADLLALEPPEGSVTLAVDRKVTQIFDLDDATKVELAGGRIVAISKTLATYNAIDCGLFLCTPAIFGALGEVVARKGDASLSEGMSILGGRGRFLPFDIGDRWWQDVDTPEMLAEAASELSRHKL
jgi:1L-myo-inositol 1-phosphate cytidylyltransferase